MRYLEAIETNDYKRLPGGIFNRSFIKAYAKYVGFDEQAALEGYTQMAREQGDPGDDVTSTPYQPRVYTDGSSRSPLVTLLLTVLILAILSLGVWGVVHWLKRPEAAQSGSNPPAPATQSAQPASAPTTTANAPTLPVPAETLHVQFKGRGQKVYLTAFADDSKKAVRFSLQADETREFDPQQSLKVVYAPAKALEVTINGRPVKVPQDKVEAEMLITKDNYVQLLQ